MKTLQENLKVFYLGLENNEPYLYKNKDLTTHALIIGMTGSGKTGLGITLLEEACIDNIPSIIIDPKGDLANLALSFSKASDFEDFGEESKKASELANALKNGLEESFQSLKRVELLKNSAEIKIYTPKASFGNPINILGDFSVPFDSNGEILNGDELNSHTLNLACSLLSLANVGISDHTSPEILLVQSIFNENFLNAKSLDLATLIAQIINPPFDKIGVMPINSFFNEQKRMSLAMKINALIASPSFKAWCEGQSLNIAKMLFSPQGKARANIFSIAHLNDSERMFFVSILLNSILAWMRTQEGTSALRAILYMDEIAGFFPPNANPASKAPMLTLLKQARAFGLGCVLSTQNPVDIDYKGLSNIGTWLIGRLQTAQDKERVIDGLLGVGSQNTSKNELEKIIASLPKRNFLVKNINDESLRIIRTRYALSYLKGPLDKNQISKLCALKNSADSKQVLENSQPENSKNSALSSTKMLLSSGIEQAYIVRGNDAYEPFLFGSASVRFCDNKGLDFTKQVRYLLDANDDLSWQNASSVEQNPSKSEPQNAQYCELNSKIAGLKDFKELKKSLKDFLYRNEKLELFSALGLVSKAGESKEQFLARLQDKANELLEAKTDELVRKFAATKAKIDEKLRKANEKIAKEKSDFMGQGLNTALSIGGAILGLFGGSKTSVLSRAISGAKSAGRVLNENSQLKNASEQKELIEDELKNLSISFNNEIAALKAEYDIQNIKIEIKQISPKKSDIFDENVILAWRN